MRRFSLALFLALFSSAVLAAEEIQPIVSFSVPMSYHGTSWVNAYVRMHIKNIAYRKNVSVVYEQEGQKEISKASYVGPAEDGWEIWEAYSNLKNSPATFRLEYKVNGERFETDQQGSGLPLRLGPVFYSDQKIQQLLSREFYSDRASFVAVVEADKDNTRIVEVHYSFDNFLTTHSQRLSYQETFLHGYGIITSPTPQNTEMWIGHIENIPATVNTISYYLSYKVDGDIYYDSNYGRNHSLTRYPPN